MSVTVDICRFEQRNSFVFPKKDARLRFSKNRHLHSNRNICNIYFQYEEIMKILIKSSPFDWRFAVPLRMLPNNINTLKIHPHKNDSYMNLDCGCVRCWQWQCGFNIFVWRTHSHANDVSLYMETEKKYIHGPYLNHFIRLCVYIEVNSLPIFLCCFNIENLLAVQNFQLNPK